MSRVVLPAVIRELARERGDSPAIVDVTGDNAVNWAQLHERNLLWAAGYRAVGVEPGDNVVTMLPNSVDAYACWLGLGWLRAIETPANNMYLGGMLRYVIQHSGARVAVIDSRYLERLADIASDLTSLTTVIVPDVVNVDMDLPFRVVSGKEFLSTTPIDEPEAPLHCDVGAMIYTSGTTGPSKGVLVPWELVHQSPASFPTGFLLPDTQYYSTYPIFHMSGKWNLAAAATYQATLVIREAFSVSEFWNDIRRHEVRSAALIGPLMAMLMNQPPTDADLDNSLEDIMSGPVLPEIGDFMQRFGVKRYATAYGMTEMGFPLVSGWNPPNTRTCGRLRTGPPGFEVRLVDSYDEPVPQGEVGELIARSAEPWVITPAYWAMPEQTAAAWRNGWFHTGDAFYEDEDGWFYFVDRRKDALRRRGENISSFEVEAGIREHDDVAEVAVIGVPSELGEDDVKAVIVRTPGTGLAPEELIEWLEPRLPRFMLPRYIEFVDALPKTEAMMRVQKFELRKDAVNANTWDRQASR